MKFDIYQKVTDTILAQLEKGALPWVKPWRSIPGLGMPCNATTNRPYSGGNVIMLLIAQELGGYKSSRWLTFKQAQEAGGTVRKGEKATMVTYVNRFAKEGNTNEDAKIIPFLKAYSVFNIEQCDGLPESITEGKKVYRLHDGERDQYADQFIETTGAKISEGGQAYYRPSTDEIVMPKSDGFKSMDHFYATLFHELGHWTGHKDRCARDLSGRFGNRAYAAEELVAELTSAFLCAEFDMDGDLRHAGYIENWIELLKSDCRAFMTAASKAQQAADYLRGLALKDEKEAA